MRYRCTKMTLLVGLVSAAAGFFLQGTRGASGVIILCLLPLALLIDLLVMAFARRPQVLPPQSRLPPGNY